MKSKALAALFIASLMMAPLAVAQSRWGSGLDFTQRAANREKSRWSLTEWLAMKDRNRMMDMWLSVNSPSPYEFRVGAIYQSYKTQQRGSNLTESFNGISAEATAHAQFIGLSVEYFNNTAEGFNDLAGLLNVRVLGNSLQNTGLTLHFGQRTRQQVGDSNLVQNFAQGSLQIYLTKFFGLDGKYRQYLPTSNSSLEDVEGTMTEAGLFIDFKSIRVFGSWYQETQSSHLPMQTERTYLDRTGLKSGLKFFF